MHCPLSKALSRENETEIVKITHSAVCTEEDEDDPYFDSSAYFFFYKTALKLSELEEKVNAMVIRGFIFFCYYALAHWITAQCSAG